MFERFTQDARDVVVRAQQEARALQHNWIGTEHLLVAALAEPTATGVTILTGLGLSADRCRAAIGEMIGPDGFDTRDADALRTLGIDLDDVRRRVEASFGAGALDSRQRRRYRWPRRRDNVPAGAGHIPFCARAKKALERSLREALALGDRYIGVEHILLGLLDPGGNTAVDVLRHLHADPKAVRAQLLAELGKAA
jgi:ATP-dependent Clp protease ATP-binding subunit ClpA